MTSGVSPALADKLAQTQAHVQARAREISEGVAAKSKEIEDESQRMREAAEQRSRELDAQVQQRIAEQAETGARSQWPQRSVAEDATYQLGVSDEDVPSAHEPAQTTPPAAPAASRGRHARRDGSADSADSADSDDTADDDYFSNSGWLQ